MDSKVLDMKIQNEIKIKIYSSHRKTVTGIGNSCEEAEDDAFNKIQELINEYDAQAITFRSKTWTMDWRNLNLYKATVKIILLK